jgi:CRP-like cAMP-binding protein
MAAYKAALKPFLLDTPFFGGLSDASLDVLIPMLGERRFGTGQTVVKEGEPGRSMFIVHSGELAVSMCTPDGRSVRLNTLVAGDFFGEMTLLDMQVRSATVAAQTASVLFELSAGSLYRFYKADIHGYVLVLQNINRELCRRLRHSDSRFAG